MIRRATQPPFETYDRFGKALEQNLALIRHGELGSHPAALPSGPNRGAVCRVDVIGVHYVREPSDLLKVAVRKAATRCTD